MIRDFRNFTSCACLLVPSFFHCIQSISGSRPSYESLCLELVPLYACDRHHVPVIVTKPIPTAAPRVPRKLLKFTRDSSSSARAPYKVSERPGSVDLKEHVMPTVAVERTQIKSEHSSLEHFEVTPLETTTEAPDVLSSLPRVIFNNSPFSLPRDIKSAGAQFKNSTS